MVKINVQKKTESGIYIPDQSQRPQDIDFAEIVEVGTGINSLDTGLSAGIKILYQFSTSQEIEFEGAQYAIVEFDDILAIVSD